MSIFYCRYILNYSPAIYKIDGKEFATLDEYRSYINITSNEEHPIQESIPYYGRIKVPGKDFGSGKTSIVLILTAVLVDSFAMAGIYVQYKGKIHTHTHTHILAAILFSNQIFLIMLFFVFNS